jgi:hypothetical protein
MHSTMNITSLKVDSTHSDSTWHAGNNIPCACVNEVFQAHFLIKSKCIPSLMKRLDLTEEKFDTPKLIINWESNHSELDIKGNFQNIRTQIDLILQ